MLHAPGCAAQNLIMKRPISENGISWSTQQ